jgi:hypothetical protein
MFLSRVSFPEMLLGKYNKGYEFFQGHHVKNQRRGMNKQAAGTQVVYTV